MSARRLNIGMRRRARPGRAARFATFAFLQKRFLSRALNVNVLAITCAILAVTTSAQAHSIPQTIEAQGHGEVLVKPTAAIVTVSVVSKGTTAQEAVKRNAATDKAIANALLAKALANKDDITPSEPSIISISRTDVRSLGPQWHAFNGINVEFPAAENVLLSLLDAATKEHWVSVSDNFTKNGKSTFGIQIYGEGGTAKDAAAIVNERMRKMINLVKARVPEARITPFGMRVIAPQNRNVWERREAPYTARNELLIRVAPVASVPAAFDEAMAAGANGVSYVNFILRDPSKAQTKAIYEATKDAKLKAQAEAAALGVKLGPLLKSSVPEPGQNAQDHSYVGRQFSLHGLGDIRISADVTLTYQAQ